jgi:hypothetical protein
VIPDDAARPAGVKWLPLSEFRALAESIYLAKDISPLLLRVSSGPFAFISGVVINAPSPSIEIFVAPADVLTADSAAIALSVDTSVVGAIRFATAARLIR